MPHIITLRTNPAQKIKALRRPLLGLLAARQQTGCGEIIDFLLPDLSDGQTPVTLVDGRRLPISQIQAGERIKAWDAAQGRVITAEVEAQLVHSGKFALHLIKGADGDELRLTGNHPVYTREVGWLPVDQLRPGMTLMQFDHDSRRFVPTYVLSIIREESSAERVYNLKTSAGNFFAADILVHNKCLAAGSLIETADGPRPIERIRPGDQVWDLEAGQRVLTRVRKVYAKATVLETLAGKRLNESITMTVNHRLFWQGRWGSAAETNLPDAAIKATVYDLLTETGSYLAGGVLMGGPQTVANSSARFSLTQAAS